MSRSLPWVLWRMHYGKANELSSFKKDLAFPIFLSVEITSNHSTECAFQEFIKEFLSSGCGFYYKVPVSQEVFISSD